MSVNVSAKCTRTYRTAGVALSCGDRVGVGTGAGTVIGFASAPEALVPSGAILHALSQKDKTLRSTELRGEVSISNLRD